MKYCPNWKKAGNLAKIEDYTNKIGCSERTDAVIEPKLSMQWFMKMEDISKPALEAVMSDGVQFHPAKFKNTYKHWMENIQDWCISRQLWWGHRIPAYYIGSTNDYVVAKTKEEALKLAMEKTGKELTMDDIHQDEDVMDTWFSSWLWPMAVFDGIRNPESEEINYYYPTNDLVTAPEIMFFWVARMIIAGYEYKGDLPFKNVYYTGIVRDKLRRKMSKSLGNSPDPIELMKIYGADGVRVGMLLCSPAGGDLLFDESLPEQGRNFTSKIWNAFRLVHNWEVDEKLEQPEWAKQGIEWFSARLNQVIETLNDHFDKFRLSDALMTVYRLFWDDFSSWFLEVIKPAYQTPCDAKSYEEITALFEKVLKVLHPFMPFITEEIWHLIRERDEKDCIMLAQWPEVEAYDATMLEAFEDVKAAIAEIRTVRKERNIAMREAMELKLIEGKNGYNTRFDAVLAKLGNLTGIEQVSDKVENAASFMVRTTEFFVPLGDKIDVEAELKKLEEELKYNKGFLTGVMKKLSNEKFVSGAPEKVVELERKKQADAEAKIKALEEQIAALKK
jgi:valyl-tRNA synthetase